MKNYKIEPRTTAFWLIKSMIGEDHELWDKMTQNEDGSYPIIISVGGVELDFTKVVERIDNYLDDVDKNIDDKVADKAMEILEKKYDGLMDDIYDLQERVKGQKERLKYDWEIDESSITDQPLDVYTKMAKFINDQTTDCCHICNAIEITCSNSCCDDETEGWCIHGVADWLRCHRVLAIDNKQDKEV